MNTVNKVIPMEPQVKCSGKEWYAKRSSWTRNMSSAAETREILGLNLFFNGQLLESNFAKILS